MFVAEIRFLTIEQLTPSRHQACWSPPRFGFVTSYVIELQTARQRDSLRLMATGARQCADLRAGDSGAVDVRIRGARGEEEGVERRLLYDTDVAGGELPVPFILLAFLQSGHLCAVRCFRV